MNRYSQLYYILFFLLIMGAFASMAQNSYGLNILGFVGISLAIIFLWRGIGLLKKKGPVNIYPVIELFSLAVISVLLSLRVFYIRIPGIEILLLIAGILLIAVYTRKMISQGKAILPQQPKLAFPVILYYSSLILFLLAMIFMPFQESVAETIGVAAFMLLIIDIIYCTASGSRILNGKTESGFSVIFKLKDHSLLITSIFFLFSLYLGLNRGGVLPGLYSDEYPQAYFKLVEKSATGKDKPGNGVYPYQEFKKNYDAFINRNIVVEK